MRADDIFSNPFHECALVAYATVMAETESVTPDSESVRKLAYNLYEKQLIINKQESIMSNEELVEVGLALAKENYHHMSHIQYACHAVARGCGWWTNSEGTEKIRNDGEMIALMHSELSEALEGLRKDKMDEHLPHRKSAEVELADTVIRIFDFAEAKGFNVAKALVEKLRYNAQREDHKPAVREAEGGKKF